MSRNQEEKKRGSSLIFLPVKLFVALVAVTCVVMAVYRPDSRVATLVPGNSPGPAFVVQVVRPRLGLPAAGLIPPQLVGLDGHLGFDTISPGAAIRKFTPGRIELVAEGWDLVLVHENGRIMPGTEIVFTMVFEERPTRVRCRPAHPAVGQLTLVQLEDRDEWAGNFEMELAYCDHHEIGKPLGWPPSALILHGSFDRLTMENGHE
jgi:hypothetical protein